MKPLRIAAIAIPLTLAVIAWTFAGEPAVKPQPSAADSALVVHEWGTFTSFSGSDGVPAHFSPNYTDLPDFIYSQSGPETGKGGRLLRDGTVSMETPVLYFYTDREMKASVTVGFPKGWITEWYPFASQQPTPVSNRQPGQTMKWNVRLMPNEDVALPVAEKDQNHYYRARETDAVPLQAEVVRQPNEPNRHGDLRGGTVVQREKFLFYRGVGTFPPPVTMKALGGGEVRIVGAGPGTVDGLLLVNVQGNRVGFNTLGSLAAGADVRAAIPTADGDKSELADAIVKQLTAAGLFEKEAKAMVKTWDSAWFGESGTRLLYLVPRSRTDELLPLTISPKPTNVVRVLVGRHDFLTPEQEATAERQLKRLKQAQAELSAAETELQKIGRFHWQARQQAEQRLEKSTSRR